MSQLLELSEMENEDTELVPDILPVDARLSIQGQASVLIDLLQSAVDIVPTKEIIPNTGYVKIEGVPGSGGSISHVRVSSTDGERSLSVVDDSYTVRLHGSVLVAGKRLLDILKLAPSPEVRIDVFGTSATVRSGRAVWTLAVPPAENIFPSFTSIDDIEPHSLEKEEFLRTLELIYPAVSKSTSRQALMQAELTAGKIVSCDGIRAHKVTLPDFPKTVHTTLPLRFIESAIRELRRFDDETVEFGASSASVFLRLGKTTLVSQRLNFEYPKVEHLVIGPALTNEERVSVPKDELIETIKRVRVNADPDFHSLTLSLRGSGTGWNLTVRARDKKGNASQETLEVAVDGPASPKDITVNHRYLLEFLACFEENSVTLKLGESSKSKQAPIYASTGTFEGVLMPMASNFVK